MGVEASRRNAAEGEGSRQSADDPITGGYKTYGSLGAIIIFLVWLWLTNIAILLGAELNAETQRARQIEAGHPREREPLLPPRDAPAQHVQRGDDAESG